MQLLNRSVILNVVIILALSAVLVLSTSIFLNFYTKHNKVAFLPALTGKDFKASVDIFDSLYFDLEVDSLYSPKYKPGAIVSQVPRGGKEVKYKRNVLVVYNKYIRPTVKLPNFLNLTLRSASILLKKNMLLIGDTVFKHDITKGVILEQWVNGKKLNPGVEIPVGMKVSFVVSAGLGEPNIPMRLLVGMTYPEMMQFMRMNELNPQILWSGAITDTNSAKVYMQYPMHINNYNQVNYVAAGEYINVSVMQSPSDSLLKIYSHVEIIPLPDEDINEYNDYDFSYMPSDNAIIDLSPEATESDMDREIMEQRIEEQLKQESQIEEGVTNPPNNSQPLPAQPLPAQPKPESKSDPSSSGSEPNKPKAVLPKRN